MDEELTSKRCVPCEGGVPPLDEGAVTDLLRRVPGWVRSSNGAAIEREFQFRSYAATLLFVNAVGWMAERENHHPILEIHYDRCIVRYFTHAISGLSGNDFICAAKTNALYAE